MVTKATTTTMRLADTNQMRPRTTGTQTPDDIDFAGYDSGKDGNENNLDDHNEGELQMGPEVLKGWSFHGPVTINFNRV